MTTFWVHSGKLLRVIYHFVSEHGVRIPSHPGIPEDSKSSGIPESSGISRVIGDFQSGFQSHQGFQSHRGFQSHPSREWTVSQFIFVSGFVVVSALLSSEHIGDPLTEHSATGVLVCKYRYLLCKPLITSTKLYTCSSGVVTIYKWKYWWIAATSWRSAENWTFYLCFHPDEIMCPFIIRWAFSSLYERCFVSFRVKSLRDRILKEDYIVRWLFHDLLQSSQRLSCPYSHSAYCSIWSINMSQSCRI
jgi:hypothetical protein